MISCLSPYVVMGSNPVDDTFADSPNVTLALVKRDVKYPGLLYLIM